ncbi:MAG: 50S ribosomal protein L13 [Deltaproteobacteria bacterium]|jgi:large subunit ribosomal protein L13|nr:50S ribosomal protein L13 [Deltaproteobacteria bacterium]
MEKLNQKSFLASKDTAKRQWVIIDVENQVVGRAASKIADILRGKHRPTYTPHADNGDFVIVINASKVHFTGKKWDDKFYYHHTGFPGGIKEISAKKQLEKHPEKILQDAVWGMLPKNTLSRQLVKKLRVYPGSEHPHTAQNPTVFNIES